MKPHTVVGRAAPWAGSIAAVGLALAMAGTAAQAQPVPSVEASSSRVLATQDSSQGVSVQYGFHGKYERLGLAYETPSFWNYDFSGGSRLDLSLELGVGYWKADEDPDSLWHVSAIPMFRWWPSDTYYLEAGVGPSYISRARFAGKQLSTRFQFTSHVGAGVVLDKVHRIGLRYTHVSNASIKRPNPGLDLLEVSYTYQF